MLLDVNGSPILNSLLVPVKDVNGSDYLARLVPDIFTASRATLFGDSMTSQFYIDTTPTASYDKYTGVLTLTDSGHTLPTGWKVSVFNRTYSSLKKHKLLTITKIDANNYSVNVGAGLPDVPNGALSGTTFSRIHSRQGSNSWVNWLQMLLGWPFEIVYNGAQSGDTTADCIDRLEEHCLQYKADVVFMQIPGINDMSVSNGPVDEETIFSNQKTIIDSIINNGSALVCLGLTPTYSPTPGTDPEVRSTTQNMNRVANLNRRLQQYIQRLNNCIFVDNYSKIVNPTSLVGLANVAYVKDLTTDRIHYSIPGAIRVAKVVRDKIQNLFPSNHSTLPRSAVDCFAASQKTAASVAISGGIATVSISGLTTADRFIAGDLVNIFGATSSTEINGWGRQVLTADTNGFTFATTAADAGSVSGTVVISRSRNVDINPLGATTTGGNVTSPVTGTAMDGVSARYHSGSGTAVASVVANADGIGNAQRLVVSASSANDLPGFQSEVTSTLNGFAKAGNTFVFEADLRISSANWANTPISEIMFRLIANVDSVLYSAHAINTYDGLTTSSVAEDLALHCRTPELVIPEGNLTQFYWQVYVRCSGTISSNLTLDLSRRAVICLD